jgi:glycosyltransferase involved in cell wall biosynthesis
MEQPMAADREFLLDVSRAVWRTWNARRPTGIDRVALKYIEQFGKRSQADVQFKGITFVLSPRASDRLFAIFLQQGPAAKRRLLAAGAAALLSARRSPPRRGMIYLNVGHTGLDAPALPAWIAAHDVKAVYLIHDLIPITHPQFCRDGEADRHSARIENALVSAAGVIANSQATLDEVAAFASKRGLGMPPSIAAWISGGEPVQSEPLALDRPHFVTLGTIEGRKNHVLLLRIWKELIEERGAEAPILLVLGQHGWKAEAAEAMLRLPELRGHVRELGGCSDEQISAWLKGARALLMPSFVEGFGLPIIEAFAYGTPVIAGDLPVYREIVGVIPTYLDPNDAKSWKAAISAFVGDDPERKRQKRLLERYRPPEWQDHFAKVERWLEGLAAGRAKP